MSSKWVMFVVGLALTSAALAQQPGDEDGGGADDFEVNAPATAKCRSEMGWVLGSYNATQTQDYDPSCVFQFFGEPGGLPVALIGNSHGGKQSRMAPLPGMGQVKVIDMYIGGAQDNTLADGRRGRQEVTTCFTTSAQFAALSHEEQGFRRAAKDVYRGCGPQGREKIVYNFGLSIVGDMSKMDAIVMQMHPVNDKDKYCVPRDKKDREICTESNGMVAVLSPRTAQNYDDTLKRITPLGGGFESGGQPPLSFRIKDGFFTINATSSMRQFTALKPCLQAVNKAPVGQVKRCADTGKTSTVLYRRAITPDFMPARKQWSFIVLVSWSKNEWSGGTFGPTLGTVHVEYFRPDGAWEVLADQNLVIGSADAEAPYFKAGIYRQNANAEPVHVRLTELSAGPWR